MNRDPVTGQRNTVLGIGPSHSVSCIHVFNVIQVTRPFLPWRTWFSSSSGRIQERDKGEFWKQDNWERCLLNYLKSNVIQNRVVPELKFIHSRIHWVCFRTVICSIYLPVQCPCQFHPHFIIIAVRYFNVYNWKRWPPISWLQYYTVNSIPQ